MVITGFPAIHYIILMQKSWKKEKISWKLEIRKENTYSLGEASLE